MPRAYSFVNRQGFTIVSEDVWRACETYEKEWCGKHGESRPYFKTFFRELCKVISHTDGTTTTRELRKVHRRGAHFTGLLSYLEREVGLVAFKNRHY